LNKKALYIKVLLIIVIFVWYAGIFSGVLLPEGFSKLFPGIFTDRMYSLVCHQDAAKSFFIMGQKLEVCARCTGIYTGGLIFSLTALFISPSVPRSGRWLILAMIPMALDVIMYSTGIYSYSKWAAFGTGLILGSVSILYIFKSVEDYFLELKMSSNVQ
jgi:uncharacterized membrane protein